MFWCLGMVSKGNQHVALTEAPYKVSVDDVLVLIDMQLINTSYFIFKSMNKIDVFILF